MINRTRLSVALTGAVLVGALSLGHAQETVQFPDLRASYLKTGDFIGPDHVLRVRPGMNKDQVRLELGNPHFNEGLFGVKEWDYGFNFYTGKGKEYVTCQFKVIFDKDSLARSVHWKPESCADLVLPKAATPVVSAGSALQPVRQALRLAADALFAFDSDVLRPEGRLRLNELAAQLKDLRYERIDVVGHTDRLGKDSYNLALSERRARAIRAALVVAGVDESLINVAGKGGAEPIVTCTNKDRAALVACLAPNRRVDVTVHGSR